MNPQLLSPPQPSTNGVVNTSLDFKIHRQKSELVTPDKPTPRELKFLSDIDNREVLRSQIPIILIYRHNPSKTNVDPVGVIRQALSKTLVYFYPLAGRLREGANKKLMVECTGEGVIFIEADTDVTLDDFKDDLQPPFPCFEELLFDVPGSNTILNSPLLLIQVTRLKCGGFIFAIRFNHTMQDALGMVLFLNTLAEIARGANAPTIWPAWDRHLLCDRVPPHVTQTHHEYKGVVAGGADTVSSKPVIQRSFFSGSTEFSSGKIIQRSFFFGPTEISTIRKLIPPDLRSRSTTFETLGSFLWRCRTIAQSPKPDTSLQLRLVVNVRNKFSFLPLPPGYYGNAVKDAVGVATAKDIIEEPLESTLKLVQKIKQSVTEEYVKSISDIMVPTVQPNTMDEIYVLTDLTRLYKFRDVDFGWGKAEYGGPAVAASERCPAASQFIPHKNKNGVEGTLVTIRLPEPAMEKFAEEVDRVLANRNVDMKVRNPIISSL